MNPRAAKGLLFTGDRLGAQRAYELGMVNHVVPGAEFLAATLAIAERISTMPPIGLALAKKAVNQAEDLQGMRAGMDSVFGLHHFAHAHNAEVSTDALGGQRPGHGQKDDMRKAGRSLTFLALQSPGLDVLS